VVEPVRFSTTENSRRPDGSAPASVNRWWRPAATCRCGRRDRPPW